MTQTTSAQKRMTKEQWQSLISEQQKAGMTQSEFCRSKGLSLATFHNWKRKINTVETPATEAPQWIELPADRLPATQQTWDIELELPGNITLRMRQ